MTEVSVEAKVKYGVLGSLISKLYVSIYNNVIAMFR